jgi:hypothetical protein
MLKDLYVGCEKDDYADKSKLWIDNGAAITVVENSRR